MKNKHRSTKHATGLAAALLAATLAWAPVPALAEVGEVTGVDDWTSIVEGGEEADAGVDVLAVTGADGDRIWVDVTQNGGLIAEKLMYQLTPSDEADAEGNFVGILSLNITDLKATDTFTISAYLGHDETTPKYTGTVKPVVGMFCASAQDTTGPTAVLAWRTLSDGEERELAMPQVVEYEGKTYKLDAQQEDGTYRYVADSSIPDEVEGKIKYCVLGDGSVLKEDTFTITKEEGSKLVPVDNIVESGGKYYRTLQLTGDVSAKYPGLTEFSIMCVELTGDWGDDGAPYVANFRYIDVDNPSAGDMRESDTLISALLDKLIVTGEYTYTPPAYIYIKNGDVVEYWALVTGEKQPASLVDDTYLKLQPATSTDPQTIDIAYKKMDETFDAVWTVTLIDATKGVNEAGRIMEQKTFHVPSGGSETYVVEEQKNGLVVVPGTGGSYTYTYDPDNLISNTDIYYGKEGEAITDSYTVTVNFVNIANNQVLKTTSETITPDYVNNRKYLSVPLDESFVSGGKTYVRLNGQAAQIDHNYFNYDVVGGKKQKTYTVWYRDVNDDLHDTTTITTFTTVYDDVFVDRGVTTVTNLGTTTVAGGTAAGGAAGGTGATGGTATLTNNGGLNAITTGGNTTLVRDDGTSVTGERIDDEANPLAAPTQGDGKEDGTNPDGTDSNAIDTGKIAGIPIGILVGLVSGIIAALAAFLLINRKKDEEGGANEQ